MSKAIEVNTLNTPVEVNQFIQQYNDKANEFYGLQTPKIGKANNIFAKCLGFNSWSNYESMLAPGSLESITLSELMAAICINPLGDLHPYNRIHLLGWSTEIYGEFFKSIGKDDGEFTIVFDTDCVELYVECELFDVMRDGYNFTGDTKIVDVINWLSSHNSELVSKHYNDVGRELNVGLYGIGCLMFVYGNVPYNGKELMDESDTSPVYSMGKSIKDIYVNMKTYGGLYKLLIDYSCSLNEQLSIGYLSKQKIKFLMGSVLNMSKESMDGLIVLSGANAIPYSFDYYINGLPFSVFSVFSGQAVRLSLSHVESC
jgi:hypothetical protein